MTLKSRPASQKFLSTLSLRRATAPMAGTIVTAHISIHALLAESDSRGSVSMPKYRNFYPRSPCGERPHWVPLLSSSIVISIHALLAESDSDAFAAVSTLLISIHALLAESDYVPLAVPDLGKGFLSTLSLRRATTSILHKILADWDFYPRSPCGERHYFMEVHKNGCKISIHALLAESDSLYMT